MRERLVAGEGGEGGVGDSVEGDVLRRALLGVYIVGSRETSTPWMRLGRVRAAVAVEDRGGDDGRGAGEAEEERAGSSVDCKCRYPCTPSCSSNSTPNTSYPARCCSTSTDRVNT